MLKISLVLALATLAAADTNRHAFSIASTNSFGYNGLAFSLAADCPPGDDDCEGTCIPILGECCREGKGEFCPVGTFCDQGGCCKIGKVCTGDPTGCPDDYEPCGDKCMSEGAVCCAGVVCPSGSSCTDTGCSTGGSGGGSGDGGSGSGGSSDGGSGSGDSGGSGNNSDDNNQSNGKPAGGVPANFPDGAASFNTPSLLVGFVALIPFAL